MRIEVFNEADRLTVAAILVKNGYTVCQARERVEGKRSYLYFLEFNKNKRSDEEKEE